MQLADNLKTLISGDVTTDQETLKKFSRDASVFEMTPQLVVAPKTVSDIKKLVAFASDHVKEGISLTPRAAGTCMSGGPLTQSIVVDTMKYFNKVKKVGTDFAITEPGVFYRDFDKKTVNKGLILPSYPASRELCAVGGMVGNNAAGERTLCYGATIEYVKRLKVVLADGNEYTFKPLTKKELYKKLQQKDFEGALYKKLHNLIVKNQDKIKAAKPRVSKNSMGYYLWDVMHDNLFDLTKLIVGSQGTLGIITEIEFQLIRPKPHHSLLVITLDDLKNLDQVINQILKFAPESFECFDDQTMSYALKYFSEIAHRFKVCSGARLYLQFLPDFKDMLTGNLPKLTLIADFSHEDAEIAHLQALQAQITAKKLGVATKILDNPAIAEKYWVVRRESFSLLRGHADHMTSAPIIDDIIVNPEKLPQFLPELNRVLAKYKGKMIYTVAGHIGAGNFHIIPLMDLSKDDVRDIVPHLVKDVHDLTLKYDGSLAAEHNDGLIRGPFLKQMFGKDMYDLFLEVKNTFDPKGIFNPNKKVNITFSQALKFMHHN